MEEVSKTNIVSFSHVGTYFHSFYFLPFMSQLFQLNTSGRPLRLFGSAPLQIPRRASLGVYSLYSRGNDTELDTN